MIKWVRRAAVVCVAACATTNALAAASAQAAPLEYGVCKAVKAGTGVYGNAGCTVPGGKLSRVWSGLVPAEPVAVTVMKWPNSNGFNIHVGREQVRCSGAESEAGAAYVGPGGLRGLVLRLTGCEGSGTNSGTKCSSAGEPEGVIVSSPLEGEAGVIAKGTPDKDGVALIPEGGETFFEMVCGAVALRVTGATISPVKTDTMAKAEKLSWNTSGYKFLHMPRSFEGGPLRVMHGYYDGVLEVEEAYIAYATIGLYSTQGVELRDCAAGC